MASRRAMVAARMASSRVKGAWLGGGVGVVVDDSFEVVWLVVGGGSVGDMVAGGGWEEICWGCGNL